MSKIVKVRCNGSGRHVNEVDLEKALRPEVILRGKPAKEQPPIPERVVLPCKECTEGKVILTRKMIEDNL
jgi:hypothetical protein